MLAQFLNPGSRSLPTYHARAHKDAKVDRERLPHTSQWDGWAGRRCMQQLPASRTPQAVRNVLPPCAACEHAASALFAGLLRVYSGSGDGVALGLR